MILVRARPAAAAGGAPRCVRRLAAKASQEAPPKASQEAPGGSEAASGAQKADEAAEESGAETSSPSIGRRLIDGWEALSARAKGVDGASLAAAARSELTQAYAELTGADRGSVLKKSVKFHGEGGEGATEEGAAEEVDEREKQLMVVDSRDNWEKLRARLKEAPIISDILKGAGRARKAAAATAPGRAAAAGRDRINDKIEDAREFWETSQNPLVYQASSIVDAVTAETDMAAATRELRRLDPGFSMEVWRDGVSEELCPDFVSAFIRGDTVALKPWLSEGLLSRLAHEIRLRKEEGLRYDDAKIMDVEKMEIIAVQAEDNRAPIVVCQFMTQQINCIRNKEGDVVEGSPGDIRAYFYVMAFQREYDDANHELVWKVVDFQLGGGEPYY